ncbi:MAG: DUF4838 domain-containing protein [Candidatus Omnitrophota bacterium]
MKLGPGNVLAVELVKDGGPEASIILGKNASPVEKYAAKELSYYVEKISGARLPVITDEESVSGNRVFVGESRFTRELGLSSVNLESDGYLIKTIGNSLIILGRDNRERDPQRFVPYLERGTMNGVYEFLERYCDVRWFIPGPLGEVVPSSRNISTPVINIEDSPEFSYRDIYPYGGEYDLTEIGVASQDSISWWYRNRLGGVYFFACNHSIPRLKWLERFGQEHPEYFALLSNGQRDNDPNLPGHRGHICFSNPGVFKEIMADIQDYYSGRHQRFQPQRDIASEKFFNVMPQDSFTMCRCKICMKKWNEKTKASEYIWGFVSKVAGETKKYYPEVVITCGAYDAYADPPATVDIPENVAVEICQEGPYYMVNPNTRKMQEETVSGWQKLVGDRIYLWTYLNPRRNPNPVRSPMEGVPPISPHLIGEYMKSVKGRTMGMFALFSDVTRGQKVANNSFLFDHIDIYILSRLMWHPDQNVDKILADYYEKFYGPGAIPLSKFYTGLENIWRERFLTELPMGRNGYFIWEETYTPAVLGELEGYLNQAEKLAGEGVYKERIALIKKWFLGEMRKSQKLYFEEKGAIEEKILRPRVANSPIVIDGRLDDLGWTECSDSVELVDYRKGEVALYKTTAYVSWDIENLYVAFRCFEPEPERMRLLGKGRDDPDLWQDASVEVFIDPTHSHKDYFHFIINAKGMVTDAVKLEDPKKWNSNIVSRTSQGDNYWIAEMAIPMKNLAQNMPVDDVVWGVNFCRNRILKNAGGAEIGLSTWTVLNFFHQPDKFGHLVFRE